MGVAHPDVYLSADVAGPICVEGRDPESRNHRSATFKCCFLTVSYRFPRLKGSEEAKLNHCRRFEDPALLPEGTDDLAVKITKIHCISRVEARRRMSMSMAMGFALPKLKKNTHGKPFVVTTKPRRPCTSRVLRSLAQQQKRRGTGCVAASVHRVVLRFHTDKGVLQCKD